jgi:hypothetical protein
MSDEFVDYLLRHLRWSITIAVIIVVLIVGFVWWNFIWQSPQHIFSDMLTNSLDTNSVTKQLIASTNSQSINQIVRLEMGSTNAAEWLVTVSQSNTSVTSDSIGTPTTGYIRYTSIAIHPSTVSKAAEFKSLVNVWGKDDGKTDVSLGTLFNKTLLDILNAPLPPIGNITGSERQSLVSYDLNQNVFTVNYAQVKSANFEGQNVYIYPVAVHLGPYVRMMQSFAHSLGITDLESYNPDQFSTLAPVELNISVNKLSHEMVEVSYPANGFIQTYSDWGLLKSVPIPSKTIPTTILEARIQSLQ